MQDPRTGEETEGSGWALDFTLRGRTLYAALPLVFTFEVLMQAADRLQMPSQEAVEHLRIMQREALVFVEGGYFCKMNAAP